MENEPTTGAFAAAAVVPQYAFRLHTTWGDYWSLTKPEVNFLILISTGAAFYLGWQSALPAIVLMPISMIPLLRSHAGLTYPIIALALSWGFFYFGAELALHRSNAAARRLMLASIIYLPCVFILMVLHKLLVVTRY